MAVKRPTQSARQKQKPTPVSEANQRAISILLDTQKQEAKVDPGGYVDLDLDPSPPFGLAPWLMNSKAVIDNYEDRWRPFWGRILQGIQSPKLSDEYEYALATLETEPGDYVLDIGSGPGNFARRFAKKVGPEGLVIAQDATKEMLKAGVVRAKNVELTNLAFVRADATILPYNSESFDGIVCYAALHMFPQPFMTLSEAYRVLKPGGKISVLTTVKRGIGPLRTLTSMGGWTTGQRMFDSNEVVREMITIGFGQTEHNVRGFAQIINAVK